MAALNHEDERGEERSRGGGRVAIDRQTYDELQFEEKFHPQGYQRLKVFSCVQEQGTKYKVQ